MSLGVTVPGVIPLREMVSGAFALRYLLRAWDSTVQDQGYVDAQVLDTAAELGSLFAGQMTVVEVDGTLAASGGALTFTGQSTPAWGDQGAYSAANVKFLGLTLLGAVNFDQNTEPFLLSFQDNADITLTNRIYQLIFKNDGEMSVTILDGAGAALESYDSEAYVAGVDYPYAIVLGGYDANGVPWRIGETDTDYLYGVAVFVRLSGNYHLLVRSALDNTASLYATMSNYDQSGTLVDFRIPDKSLKAVLEPNNLSTFDAPNGTSLDAITPEVGGVWTEVDFDGTPDIDVQNNQARISITSGDRAGAYVNAVLSDCICECSTTTAIGVESAPGLLMRYSDNNNYWYCRIATAPNNWILVENNGDVFTARSSVSVTINQDTIYKQVVGLDGQSITGYLDGGNKLEYNSAVLNENVTNHGIQNRYDVADNDCYFDNFAIFPRTSATYDNEFGAV